MSTAPALSPDLIRLSIALARSLSAAARNWALYPPEHPAVGASVQRLADAVRQSTAGAAFAFAVTPKTLLIAGVPLPDEQPVAEAARLLHDHDLLQITFLGDPPVEALHAFLRILSTPADQLRGNGGPAPAWEQAGHASIALEQIDYEKLLEDREVEQPLADRHDDIWRSLVNTIVQGGHAFDEAQQARLLEISRSVFEIGDLAEAVAAPKCNVDGSPLITTQAATILAVFRHLAGIVTVMEPDRLPDVMRNVAAATTGLDPHVVLQMMQTEDGTPDAPVVNAIASSFDDEKVAQLLATALARDGRASARLAQVFDTIAPDEERKQRVLTMTRSMLSEQDFGKTGQFRAVWSTMEELLLGYDETPYVSAAYQASLEGAGARGDMLAGRDLPPELPEWVDSLGQDNVRALSVQLVADLLRIEENADRSADIARDMTALLDDLFLAGDFDNARLVLRELKQASTRKTAPAAARAALTSAGESTGLRDAATMLGDLDEASLHAFAECCEMIGPTTVRALHPVLQSETDSPAYRRAREVVRTYGAAAAIHLAALADDNRWFVQRNAAALLGATRSADAVPPLQSLLRRSDARVLRQAVTALAAIDDPAAARAIHTVLRAATGENRAAVIEALVAERDPRVVPMLARILTEGDPFGDDHDTILGALDAVRQLGSDQAVAPVAALMKKKKFFQRKKARAFKTASVEALVAIGTPRAAAALDEAAKTGDGLLKTIVRSARLAAPTPGRSGT
jgi:HEAT repeat protein